MSEHAHRCQKCGTVWMHGDMMAADIEAHACPKCAAPGQWRIYKGGQEHAVGAVQVPKQPTVCHGGGSISLFQNPLFMLWFLMVMASLTAICLYNILIGDE